jgi:hypothetical protein
MTIPDAIKAGEAFISALGSVEVSTMNITHKDALWNVRRKAVEQVGILRALEQAIAANEAHCDQRQRWREKRAV